MINLIEIENRLKENKVFYRNNRSTTKFRKLIKDINEENLEPYKQNANLREENSQGVYIHEKELSNEEVESETLDDINETCSEFRNSSIEIKPQEERSIEYVNFAGKQGNGTPPKTEEILFNKMESSLKRRKRDEYERESRNSVTNMVVKQYTQNTMEKYFFHNKK